MVQYKQMEFDEMDEVGLARLGRKIGATASGGEVIELIGDVGAGKTTFTRALARGLGIDEDIQSPTFTIKNQYEAPNGLLLVHYDFYRLHEAGVMRDELDEAINDTKAVVVIEWGDAIQEVLPEDRLTIEITPRSETARKISMHSRGTKSARLSEQLT